MKKIIFILLLAILTSAVFLLLIPSLLLFSPIKEKFQTAVIHFWNQSVLKIFNLKIKVQGLENYHPEKPCIIVSNHQSLLDIPVVYSLFSGCLRMVAKRELFKIPVFGWGLYLTGFIPIDRGDRKSAQKSLNMISQKLSKNYQIWMAPEGTRSSDGQLLPFKSGAFRSAIEWKVPILPCVIFNTGDIQPKGTTQIKTSSIVYVRVLPEISTQNYSIKEYSKLRDEVYQAMKSTLAQS